MKHWDSRDALRSEFAPCHRRDPGLASMCGLVIAAALVVGLAWGLAPVSPVAPELLQ